MLVHYRPAMKSEACSCGKFEPMPTFTCAARVGDEYFYARDGETPFEAIVRASKGRTVTVTNWKPWDEEDA